jgi:hypothetical protein
MILAETLPDPNSFASIGWVVVILAALAFGGNSVLDLVGRLRGDNDKATQIEPNPLPVQKIWPSATIIELKDAIGRTDLRLDRHDAEIREIREILRKEIPEIERRLSEAGEERAVKLHARINDVLAAISKIEGYCNRNHGIK